MSGFLYLASIAAVRYAKRRAGRVLSIVNLVGSSSARESDDVLCSWGGAENAEATTRAYST